MITKSAVALILVIVLGGAFESADARPAIVAKSIVYGEANDAVNARVKEVLAQEGIIAVTNVPGLAVAREQALVGTAKCVLDNGDQVAPRSVDLQDSSKRSSWAAFVDSTAPHRESVVDTANCPDLKEKMELLRDAVDTGAKFFVRTLDAAIKIDITEGLLPRRNGGVYESFQDVVEHAKHLDHFHVYEKNSNENTASLDLHTDHGLFIAVIPSIRLFENGLVQKEEDSFMIETKDARLVDVNVPYQGDVLLFMIGDGSNYFNVQSHFALRPVPHALNVAVTAERSVRAWFGRMFFAPSDALLNSNGDTYDAIISKVVNARQLNQEFLTLGCSATEKRILDAPETCAAGKAYCWMGCQSTEGLNCAADKIFCNSSQGTVWEYCENCHDTGAKLACSTTGAAVQSTVAALVGALLALAVMLVA